jgi:hypothetical protein
LYTPGAAALAEALCAAVTPGPDRTARIVQAQATTGRLTWPIVAARMFGAYDALVRERADLTRHVPPRAEMPEPFRVATIAGVVPMQGAWATARRTIVA